MIASPNTSSTSPPQSKIMANTTSPHQQRPLPCKTDVPTTVVRSSSSPAPTKPSVAVKPLPCAQSSYIRTRIGTDSLHSSSSKRNATYTDSRTLYTDSSYAHTKSTSFLASSRSTLMKFSSNSSVATLLTQGQAGTSFSTSTATARTDTHLVQYTFVGGATPSMKTAVESTPTLATTPIFESTSTVSTYFTEEASVTIETTSSIESTSTSTPGPTTSRSPPSTLNLTEHPWSSIRPLTPKFWLVVLFPTLALAILLLLAWLWYTHRRRRRNAKRRQADAPAFGLALGRDIVSETMNSDRVNEAMEMRYRSDGGVVAAAAPANHYLSSGGGDRGLGRQASVVSGVSSMSADTLQKGRYRGSVSPLWMDDQEDATRERRFVNVDLRDNSNGNNVHRGEGVGHWRTTRPEDRMYVIHDGDSDDNNWMG